MNLSAGTRLGRYEIRSFIGEGGMGQVYRAPDTEPQRYASRLPSDLYLIEGLK